MRVRSSKIHNDDGLWLQSASALFPPHPDPLPRGEREKVKRAQCYSVRVNIIFLISAIASAGFKFLGQVRAQFMMVWQR